MPFVFALRSVLGLRQNRERMEELAAAKLAAEVARWEDAKRHARQTRLEQRSNSITALRTGLTAAELHLEQQHIDALSVAEQQAAARRQTAMCELHAQQLRLLAARRERETLTELRRRKLEQFELEERRTEQKTLDNLFLLTSRYHR